MTLPQSVSQLVDTAVASIVGTPMYLGWASLPTWLKSTLGDTWNVRPHGSVTANKSSAQCYWRISDSNVPGKPSIRIHVHVFSVISQDGHLDLEKSVESVRGRIIHILGSTSYSDLWTSCTLPGLEEAPLRYADHIGTGGVIVVARNAVIEITGMKSSQALVPYARKLLDQTARYNSPLPVIPVLQQQVISIGHNDGSASTGTITVPWLDVNKFKMHFSVVCSVDCKIAAARGACDGTGVTFERNTVDEPSSGEGCTVKFFFGVREIGHHRVHMYVAELDTMVVGTSVLCVEVVDA